MKEFKSMVEEYGKFGETIKKHFISMIEKYGSKDDYTGDYELATFDLCTSYGCELDFSTIDKVIYDGDEVWFYYDANTGDRIELSEVDPYDCAVFYDGLMDAILESQTK